MKPPKITDKLPYPHPEVGPVIETIAYAILTFSL
jgi:hypothetical protein